MLGRNPNNDLERPRINEDGILLTATDGSPIGVLNSNGDAVNPATEEGLQAIKDSVDAIEGGQNTQDELAILEEILSVAKGLATARGLIGDLRISVVGGTLPTVSTVSTVATLTNMAQIGTTPTNSLVPAQLNGVAVASNINNIVVS